MEMTISSLHKSISPFTSKHLTKLFNQAFQGKNKKYAPEVWHKFESAIEKKDEEFEKKGYYNFFFKK